MTAMEVHPVSSALSWTSKQKTWHMLMFASSAQVSLLQLTDQRVHHATDSVSGTEENNEKSQGRAGTKGTRLSALTHFSFEIVVLRHALQLAKEQQSIELKRLCVKSFTICPLAQWSPTSN